MTKEQIAAIVSGIAGLAHALDAAGVKTFKANIDALVAQLRPELPVKADGSAFTDEELAAAADAARQPFLEVLARDSSSADSTGHP